MERFETERFDGMILDVREPWEVEQISIHGSLHIPLQKLQINVSKLDPDQVYYVLCTSGIRSSYAAAYLYAIGFENVYNIQGGLNGIFEHVSTRPDQPGWLAIPGAALTE
ncbi:rhodanese-like domain-containing protein [Paenibacillus thalictri]|uniref:rhodanese-like domain-containing protein n=1 Tax=Paenibacillus thalictri TaxID=2527873 RepID=UPI001F1178D9|nr:rhodanese-like domain-containing protein [Paenibacillus thalictri]